LPGASSIAIFLAMGIFHACDLLTVVTPESPFQGQSCAPWKMREISIASGLT
jgi:hypothetical protein